LLIAARQKYIDVSPKQETENAQEKEMEMDYHQEFEMSM